MRKRKIALAPAFIGLLLIQPSLGQIAANRGASTEELAGRVIYADGSPASDATVVFYQVNNVSHEVATTLSGTDSAGYFHLTVARAKAATETDVLYAESSSGVGLSADSESAPVHNIVLQRRVTLHLHVSNTSEHPLAKLIVYPRLFTQNDGYAYWSPYIPSPWKVTTDEKGDAIFEDLPENAAVRFDSLNGGYCYDPSYNWPQAIATDAGSATVHFVKTASLAGSVCFNGSHIPMSSLEVTLAGPQIPGGYTRIATNDKGEYHLDNLTPGTYVLSAAGTKTHGAVWTGVSRSVRLDPGTQASSIDLILLKDGVVFGTVLNATTGKPVANATVIASTPGKFSLDKSIQATTGPDGKYSLDVTPGSQGITVWTQGSTPGSPLQGYPEQTVSVLPGESKSLNFHVAVAAPSMSINVTVVDPRGEPVEDAKVYAIDSNGGITYGQTDANGSYVFDDKSGLVSLLARSKDLGTPAALPCDSAGAVQLQLSYGVFSTFAGTVKNHEGAPLADAKVYLYRWVGDTGVQVDSTTTKLDGSYQFEPNFSNAEYSASVSLPGYNEASTATLKAAPGEAVKFGDLVINEAKSFVTGIIVNSKGKPIPNALVRVLYSSTPTYANTTGADGRFEIHGIPSGQADISVEAPDGGWIRGYVPTDKDLKIKLWYGRHPNQKMRSLWVVRHSNFTDPDGASF